MRVADGNHRYMTIRPLVIHSFYVHAVLMRPAKTLTPRKLRDRYVIVVVLQPSKPAICDPCSALLESISVRAHNSINCVRSSQLFSLETLHANATQLSRPPSRKPETLEGIKKGDTVVVVDPGPKVQWEACVQRFKDQKARTAAVE